jgi:uncharacterized protein YfaA (DUF2138 family)
MRLAIAATKSKAVATEVVPMVAKAAGATLAAWNMDDVAKFLMAMAKAKDKSDCEEVVGLYGRAAESVMGKLESITDAQFIKILLAVCKAPSMKDFLAAMAQEAVKRLPKTKPAQLLFTTQGLLPLGATNSDVAKVLDHWASLPDETEGHLNADQTAQLAHVVAL